MKITELQSSSDNIGWNYDWDMLLQPWLSVIEITHPQSILTLTAV